MGIVLAVLAMSLWSGSEPTIPILLKAGFSKIQIASIYAFTYMFTLNLFIWWPVLMEGKVKEWDEKFKEKKWWVKIRSWSKKIVKAIEVPSESQALKQSTGSFIFKAATFYAMGIGHLYFPGNVLVMLEPWTWRKFILGACLYLGAVSRVVAALLIWQVLASIGGWLPWVALVLFILYIIYQKSKKKKIAVDG